MSNNNCCNNDCHGVVSLDNDHNPSTIPNIQVGTPYNNNCNPFNPPCSPFDLTTQTKANDYMASLTAEHLEIGGAVVNVYRLLGVHEQCKLVDSTGNGSAMSGGDTPGFPAINAFDAYQTEWRSLQKGGDILVSSYIGYDFGTIKTSDRERDMYGIDTSIRKMITSIDIKQSNNPNNRVTKIRIERSDDGKKWYGVAIAPLPNDSCLNEIQLKHSAPMRYWRIRPLEFAGGNTNYWGVQALKLIHNNEHTHYDNIQDKIFLENRDRDYSTENIILKGQYDLVDSQSELSKFGIELPTQIFYISMSFSQMVYKLGRPMIIGDILELPSETMYTPTMRPIKKWLEVTDVSWSTEGYTPGWKPTIMRVIAQPAYASQETQNIFGDMANHIDSSGLFDKNDGNNQVWQDYFDSTHTIIAQAKDMVPESGAEGSSAIRQFTDSEKLAASNYGVNLGKIEVNPKALYLEDAMPPNNAPFTEGDTYPDSPSDGDYHRLTYTNLKDYYPPCLYRYSGAKGRWLYLETDRREQYNGLRPIQEEFLKPYHVKADNKEISRDINRSEEC